MTKIALNSENEICPIILKEVTEYVMFEKAEIKGQQMTAVITLKRRPWIKRLWRFPKTWRHIYLVARKDNKKLASLKLGFMLACLTLKQY